MLDSPLHFEAVREFCSRREVDLVLRASPSPETLCLRAQFDGYGDFFSIHAINLDYGEIAGSITLGDMRLLPDVVAVSALSSRWLWLQGVASGITLALMTADAESWQAAQAGELFLIVASEIEFRAGSDWKAECSRLKVGVQV